MIDTVITRNLTVESLNAGWVHAEATVTLDPPYRAATATSALAWVRGGGQAKAAIVAYEHEVYDKFGRPTGNTAAYLRLEPPPINTEERWLNHGKNSVTVKGLRSITFELSANDMLVSGTLTVLLHKPPSLISSFLAILGRLSQFIVRG